MDARTGLADASESEAWLAERTAESGPLVIALLDIDRLNEFNDVHGHVAGNGVLTGLADLIRDAAGSADLAARFGDDEFLLAWPGDNAADAAHELEQLRHRFHERTRLTLSAGVAELENVHASPAMDIWRSLVRAADLALDDAKKAGGDCVRIR